MLTTSASLLARVQHAEDRQAWTRFVQLYTPLIYRWGRHAGLNDADAADLVQEVLLALVKALPRFELNPAGGFRKWLKTVTLNKWRDWARRRALPTSAFAPQVDRSPTVPDHADQLADADYRAYLLGRALDVMRKDFQPATWRACWEVVANGRRAEDVARELGVTTGAVHAARFRVMVRLRQELDGLLD
jgi:RNA polymerase sigma-70 factor (ECF subfamily)